MHNYIILYGNALEGVVTAIGEFDSEYECENFLVKFPAEKHLVTKIIALEKPDDGDWNEHGY